MIEQQHGKNLVFKFYLRGERDTYEVSFRFEDGEFHSTCTCSHKVQDRLCWHKYYILAGRRQRIQERHFHHQDQLIRRLEKTNGGGRLLREAKGAFGDRETCRRCNKGNVVEINHSLVGRMAKLFLPRGRKYLCKSCGWSW